MAKKTHPVEAAPAAAPKKILIVLAVLGLASAAWAGFLWLELIDARTGGTAFCGFGESADCGALWDTPFASTVQGRTGLPVAAWGLLWGLLALWLPLMAQGRTGPSAWVTAIKLTAVAGLVAVGVLAAVSVGAGIFCLGCLVTYVLTGAYAAVALAGLRRSGWVEPGRGLAYAAGGAFAAFLLLLYPGLATPDSTADAGREAVAALIPAAEEENGASAPATASRTEAPTDAPAGPAAPSPAPPPALAADPLPPAAGGPRLFAGPPIDDPDREARLRQLVGNLQPRLRQVLSNDLYAYLTATAQAAEEPRALAGPAAAPVRITTFSDPLCPACASLHATLETLREAVPEGFSVDERWYPLDAACNPNVQRQTPDALRCFAAKAAICLEGRDPDFAGEVFARQRGLTRAQVVAAAAPTLGRAELERCVESPTTEAKLAADVAWAERYDIHGTPLVLVNGRQGTSFAPFLYTLILTEGRGGHPALVDLPPPDPTAAHRH